MEKYEDVSDYRKIYRLVPIDTVEENSLITKERKEYVKPQIKTVDGEINK